MLKNTHVASSMNKKEKLNSPITTIPCIGAVLGAIIISEFCDISYFDKSSKLVTYTGIDATISQ